ncbi:hypothetical protein [uncultured Aliiroseovarius sp.]|uniref:hypothetical protein n=1 Tax=uncultured Aliiroseovarius sp. TaxID=1658783 RepID=UPI002635ED8A|nr:hypothetical protein [uncultured Aliiroseovarius sp.]
MNRKPGFRIGKELRKGRVGCATQVVPMEGFHLPSNSLIKRDLRAHWDLALRLDVDEAALQICLVEHWLAHGLPADQALTRAEENDLPNARAVARNALAAEISA